MLTFDGWMNLSLNVVQHEEKNDRKYYVLRHHVSFGKFHQVRSEEGSTAQHEFYVWQCGHGTLYQGWGRQFLIRPGV